MSSLATKLQEPSSGTDVPVDRPRPPRRSLALLMTLVAPGAGHVLRGHMLRGFVWALGLSGLGLVLVFAMPVSFATIAVAVVVGPLALLACALDTLWLSDRAASWKTILVSWAVLLISGGFAGDQLTSYYKANYVQAFSIPSASMDPTIALGDFVLTDKSAYRSVGPRRGDIIVFKYPLDERRDFIKRVIGVPGDRIEFRGRQVLVNGHVLDEPYVKPAQEASPMARCLYVFGCDPTYVPVDSYFVMGDNRDNSQDSRHWGVVRRAKVVGRAFAIYWSWDPELRRPRLTRVGMAL
jgi:signal peptidase I